MPVTLLESAGSLPEHLPLWRYTRLSSLFLLFEGQAFLPSVATLRSADPLEGEIYADAPWISHALAKEGPVPSDELDTWLLSMQPDWIKKGHEMNKMDAAYNTSFFAELYQRELAKRRAVWCWFASDIESAAMWSVYGSGGVAIGTTIGKIKSALPSQRPFQVSKIRYADRRCSSERRFNPESSEDEPYIHRPHFIKGCEYSHEQEVRVATSCHGQDKGVNLHNIAVGELITDIVLSPLWPHREARAVEKLLRSRRWQTAPAVRRSALLGHLPDEDDSHEKFELFFEEHLAGFTGEADVPQLLNEL